MNDDELRLPPIPLDAPAAARVRAVVRHEARQARLRMAEAALHGGFAIAATIWAFLAVFSG